MRESALQSCSGGQGGGERFGPTHKDFHEDDVCPAETIAVEKVRQDARDYGGGRQNQEVVEAEPASRDDVAQRAPAAAALHGDKYYLSAARSETVTGAEGKIAEQAI